MDSKITMEEMKKRHAEKVVELISKSMNKKEGNLAKNTIDFHFFCKKNKKDDGRSYFVVKIRDKIIGIAGLHRYIWDYRNIVWLGWFAVDQKFQKQGIGTMMIDKICRIAKKKDIKRCTLRLTAAKHFLKQDCFM